MHRNGKPLGYEELRPIVIDEIIKGSGEFRDLEERVARAVLKQQGAQHTGPMGSAYQGAMVNLHPSDASTILEIFWDLFRQGVITLGKDSSNPNWPWFRLSRFGQTISKSTIRFHDTASYVALMKSYDKALSSQAITYLEEAAASFYAECLLAATVMLGAAAETEFLNLLDLVATGKHGTSFTAAIKERFIKGKIQKFLAGVSSLTLPKECTEDLDTKLLGIQSVIRIARNDAGHPSGTPAPAREQVYVYLQLFGPYAQQLSILRKHMA